MFTPAVLHSKHSLCGRYLKEGFWKKESEGCMQGEDKWVCFKNGTLALKYSLWLATFFKI